MVTGVVIGMLLCATLPVFADTIAIVTKDDISAFSDHAVQLEKLLKPAHEVLVVRLNENDESDTLQKVVDARPDLVYTVGSKVTHAMVRGLPTNIPIVYGMVLNPAHLNPRRLMAGRSLEIPNDIRLRLMKSLFPHMSRVGVLEGPSKDMVALRRNYAHLARELDLDIFVEVVGKRGELQDVLNTLFSQRVDVVISTPTARIYNANDMRYLILFLSRYKVPYLALSPSYLDMGALVSIDVDFEQEALASQALIESVLLNPSMAGIPRLTAPTKVTYTINSTVLRQFRFRLTQTSIDGAKEMRE